MTKEEISNDQPKPRWFIDLDWLQQNNRSISDLTQGYLCAKCRKQLLAEGKKPTEAELLTTIKDCCGNAPEFITGQSPILESIFRFFLANGNQPLTLEELGNQLSERRGGDTSRTSEEILSRLLESDRYYGLQPVPD
ncbi:MAG: hypothetical protein ACE5KP_00975 [Dehalococcoidales bacterium]